MKPEDALATSMLICFAFAFGVLFTIFITMVRSAGKKDELEELRDIIEGAPKKRHQQKKKSAKKSKAPPKKLEPWEKDADWWKSKE